MVLAICRTVSADLCAPLWDRMCSSWGKVAGNRGREGGEGSGEQGRVSVAQKTDCSLPPRCDQSRRTMRGRAGSACTNLAQRRRPCAYFLSTHSMLRHAQTTSFSSQFMFFPVRPVLRLARKTPNLRVLQALLQAPIRTCLQMQTCGPADIFTLLHDFQVLYALYGCGPTALPRLARRRGPPPHSPAAALPHHALPQP